MRTGSSVVVLLAEYAFTPCKTRAASALSEAALCAENREEDYSPMSGQMNAAVASTARDTSAMRRVMSAST